MIKTFYILLLSSILFVARAQESEQLDCASTVIAFDLHGVVFKTSPSKVSVCLRNFPNKWLMAKLLLNPRFWYNVVALRKQTEVAEDIYGRLSVLYPELAHYEKEFIEIANAQEVQQEVVGLIKELKKKQFKVYICSNIGSKTFVELEKQFPEVIGLFDGVYTTSQAHNYIQKPQPQFFNDFKQFVVAHEKGLSIADILLIDDKEYNTKSAQECGFKTLLFTTKKQFVSAMSKLMVG
ncbi:HAD hydrolase-like protein [Candidatus Dependentiae bacterium]|nr:HAD hydrolase-like protein [Candidatus Dependentiae bacterium]